jgi:hypothetical protein
MFTIGISVDEKLIGLAAWDAAARSHVGARSVSIRRGLYALYHPLFDYVAARQRQGQLQAIAFYAPSTDFSARLVGMLTAIAAEFGIPLLEVHRVDARQARALVAQKSPVVARALAAALSSLPQEERKCSTC